MLMRSPGKARRQLSGCSMTTERDHFRGLSPRRSRTLQLGRFGFWDTLFGDGGGGGQQQQQGMAIVGYTQDGAPVYGQPQQQQGGGFWSEVTKGLIGVTAEVTKGVGSIGETVGFVAHPQEYAAKKQAEAATAQAQAYAVGQQTQQMYAQLELEKAQQRARTFRWVIGGVVLVGGGLVFAKILRRT